MIRLMAMENDGFVSGPRAGYFRLSSFVRSSVFGWFIMKSFFGSLKSSDPGQALTVSSLSSIGLTQLKEPGNLRRRSHFKEHRLCIEFPRKLGRLALLFLFPLCFLRFCGFCEFYSLNSETSSKNKEMPERKWVIILNLTMTCFFATKRGFLKNTSVRHTNPFIVTLFYAGSVYGVGVGVVGCNGVDFRKWLAYFFTFFEFRAQSFCWHEKSK